MGTLHDRSMTAGQNALQRHATCKRRGLFQLLYDSVRNVLLTRLSGVYCEEDIVLRDRQVAAFVARNGLARGPHGLHCRDRGQYPDGGHRARIPRRCCRDRPGSSLHRTSRPAASTA